MATYERNKTSLFQSFLNSKERGFNDDQLKLAKDSASLGGTLRLSQKYELLKLGSLIKENDANYLKLNNALGLVLQYITDLLSPDLPPNWWSISTRNPTYGYRMKNVTGVEEIFSLAGYTKKTQGFLSFPEGDKQKPDRELLARLATEILLAREECSALSEGKITLLPDTHPSTDPPLNPTPTRYENVSLYGNSAHTRGDHTHLEHRIQSFGFQPQHNRVSGEQPNVSPDIPIPDTISTPPSGVKPPVPKPRNKLAKRNSSTGSSPTQSPSSSGAIDSYGGSFDESFEDTRHSGTLNEPGRSGSTSSTGSQDDPGPSTDLLSSDPELEIIKQRRERVRKRMQALKEKKKPDLLPPVGKKALSTPLRSSLTTHPRSQEQVGTILEEDIPVATPTSATPTKCPKCQNHLNGSNVCSYCATTSRPHPVPRKRRSVKTEIQPPRQPINSPPAPLNLPRNNSGPVTRDNPPSIPIVPPYTNNSGPHNNVPPQSNNSGPRDNMSPYINNSGPRTNSGSILPITEDESMGTLVAEDKESNDSLHSTLHGGDAHLINEGQFDVIHQQYVKCRMESEHFASLSQEKQDEFLEKKVNFNESVTHLRELYKGRNWYGTKEQKEIDAFIKMDPLQQQEVMARKMMKQEKTGHLAPYYNATCDSQRQSEEQKRKRQEKQDKTKMEGSFLCKWIKHCAKEGYTPQEVEIAVNESKDPLEFLQSEWNDRMKKVETMIKHNRKNPGLPLREEIRKHLIEAKGNFRTAGKKCIDERLLKIKELEEKLAGRLQVERSVLVTCLGQCDLNVEDAYYAVQRKNLTELYKYLISSKEATDSGEGEGKKSEGKSDMDVMKDIVIEKTKDEEGDKAAYESCIRMLIAENKFKERSKAEMLIALLKDKSDYPMMYYIDAAKNYNDFDQARSFLNQPCPICVETYLMDDMVVMPACGCALCKECFVDNFTVVIKEQSVKHFNCPMCGKPDVSNETQDMNIELFVAIVKEFCDKELYELCQKKLTEFSLSKQPNFVWCINQQCLSGFLTDRDDRIRVECPTCKKDMCFLCKKKWEHQHEGITCDQFTQWKIDNDPEAQKHGLAAHLEENGIQCPGCKFRYDLARGGCMHFRCTQCPNEFCSGCGGTIKKGEECGKSEYCKTAGLHAHHPRDCLYYLRDFGVTELQELLTNNDVNFDIDPPKAQLDALKDKQQDLEEDVPLDEGEDEDAVLGEPIPQEGEELQVPVNLTCGVMLQKEGPEGLYDEKCGKDCPDKMAGLCNDHYKEYLVDKINKTKLDPIELYTTMQLSLILKREDMPAFEKDDETTDEDFRELLIEHIKQDIPLRR